MSEKKKRPLISVIVPVYNVEDYLDECIASIVNQSYTNLEVILIDDGSTDSSGAICRNWSDRDSRIRYITKENQGQAAARNDGVAQSTGELLTFVDADDWLDHSMLEKLYTAMEQYDTDISMCEAYTGNIEGYFSRFSLQRLDRPCIDIQKEREYLLSVRYTLWSKLYKKILFTRYKIQEPSIKFEDVATVPAIYALADKVACVDEALYYYRYRAQSTSRDMAYVYDRIYCLQHLIDLFHRLELDEAWESILRRICTERGLIMMRQVYPLLSKHFQNFCNSYDELLKYNFGMTLAEISPRFQDQCKRGAVNARLLGEYNLAVFGSYNLMIVAKIIMNLGMPDFMENHDSFSSIVSTMSVPSMDFFNWNLSHKNAYRQKHLIQDITKTFARKSPCVFQDVDFILVDFLEERFDIAEYQNDCFFTLSDAFEEIKNQIPVEYQIIKRTSTKARVLWEEGCIRFIQRLRQYDRNVILVRMLLCEGYGAGGELEQCYDNVEEIRYQNAILNSYYDFFQENMPEALVVNLDGIPLYTDKNYRHGCYPWHLSQKTYWDIKQRTLSVLKSLDKVEIDEQIKDKSIKSMRKGDWGCFIKI